MNQDHDILFRNSNFNGINVLHYGSVCCNIHLYMYASAAIMTVDFFYLLNFQPVDELKFIGFTLGILSFRTVR